MIRKSPARKRQKRKILSINSPLISNQLAFLEPTEVISYWRKQMKGHKWRPATREGATITTIGKRIFLIGGANRTISNEVV